MSAALLGLGLLPRGTLIGAGLVVASLLTLLGQRQCTVMELQDQVAAAGTAKTAADGARAQCEAREQTLATANQSLTVECKRQSDSLAELLAAESAAREQAQQASRAAQRGAADDASRAAWLADLLARTRTRADTCEAAVQQVRQSLREVLR